MRNIRLLLEYDGTSFAGWQAQRGQATIQGELMAALERITHEPDPQLVCAGRTDAGVHAVAQVVNFATGSSLPARRFTPALNHHLPPTIRVHDAAEVAATFDARKAARSKRYGYRIYEGPHPPALDRRRAWHVRRSLDVALLRSVARDLVGEHDFEAFRSAHCDAAHAVRTMLAIDVQPQPRPPVGRTIEVTLHANAFCRHMCRIVVGTLVEVAVGRRPAASVAAALHHRDRRLTGMTAPPWGLTLLEVLYGPTDSALP